MRVMQEGLIQAQVKSTSSIDLSRLPEAVAKSVAEAIKATGATATTYGEVEAKAWRDGISRQLKKLSDHVYAGRGPDDPNRQEFVRITAKTGKDGVEMPVAWAIFYPNRTGNERWKTGVYDTTSHYQVVRAQQKSGGYQNYVSGYTTIENDKKVKGIKFPIAMQKAAFAEKFVKDKSFLWWNPTVALGGYCRFSYGTASGLDASPKWGFGAGMSFMSYGRTKVDLDWRFVGLWGMMDGDVWSVGFEPFAYNLGQPLPLVHNLWLSPVVLWTPQTGEYGAALVISMML
jgi:hypothetical protein